MQYNSGARQPSRPRATTGNRRMASDHHIRPAAPALESRGTGGACPLRQNPRLRGVAVTDVQTWHRPYRDLSRVITAFFAVLISAVSVVLFAAIFVGHPTFPGAPVVILAVIAFFLTVAWRFHRTGLLISVKGCRVRWLLKTHTEKWSNIHGFRFDDDFLGTSRLWIELVDGRRIRTPVQQVERLLNGSPVSDGGAWLLPEDCDVLLRTLERGLQIGRARR